MVVAKVIKWVEVFIAKPCIEAKDDNFVPHQLVWLVFIVPIERLVHNTNVLYRFTYQLYRTHFGCTEKYIKFVPHYQDLIPFSPLLFLCLFSTFSNFQLCMFLQHCTILHVLHLSHYLFNVFYSFLLLFF